MKIAVIPARGGSKRIPRKNIKIFCGKPMIAWSIQVAKESDLFDRIIVSTDDMEIAEIARAYGAETPFMRPSELASDFAGTTEVVAHSTQWALNEGLNLQAVCCLYPSAPLIQVKDLKMSLDTLLSGDWSYVFPVAEFEASIFRAFKKNSDGSIKMIFPEHFTTRSQDLPTALHDAGQFYWGRPKAWIEKKKIFDRHSAILTLPRWRVQDIDNWEDWLKAESIFKQLGGKKDDN